MSPNYQSSCLHCLSTYYFFFFNDTATTEIYTLSLHDALPICARRRRARGERAAAPSSSGPSTRPRSRDRAREARAATPRTTPRAAPAPPKSAAEPTSDARTVSPSPCPAPSRAGCAGSQRARSREPGAVSHEEREREAHPHEPGAALRLLALEPPAGVPHEVADSRGEVIAEREDERGKERPHERQRQHAHGTRLGLCPSGHRQEPVHEQR